MRGSKLIAVIYLYLESNGGTRCIIILGEFKSCKRLFAFQNLANAL